MFKFFVPLLCMLMALPLQAAEQISEAKTLQTSPLSAVNLVQSLFGLLLVLACIVLVLWLLKRSNRFHTSASGQLNIIAGLPLGTRERIVLVQVGEEQLLLGVTPQQINTLYKLPEPLKTDTSARLQTDFAAKLKQMMQQRGGQ